MASSHPSEGPWGVAWTVKQQGCSPGWAEEEELPGWAGVWEVGRPSVDRTEEQEPAREGDSDS